MKFVLVCAVLFAAMLLVSRATRRNRRRRSLHYDDGHWYWTDFHGHSHRSETRPDAPDGEWSHESWFAGIGLGSGGDDSWFSGDSGDSGDSGWGDD